MDARNFIKSAKDRESFKVDGKWLIDEKDWLINQGSDPIVEKKIVRGGFVLESFKNMKTGVYFLRKFRKATTQDVIEQNGKDFIKEQRKRLYVPFA